MRKNVPEWSQAVSVDNELLDKQHKDLLSICDKAAELLEEKGSKGKRQFHAVLNDVFEKAIQHLSAEEEILLKHNYPKLADHKNEHRQLLSQLTETLLSAAGGVINKDQLYKLLHDWLTEHELGADMEYKEHLRKH